MHAHSLSLFSTYSCTLITWCKRIFLQTYEKFQVARHLLIKEKEERKKKKLRTTKIKIHPTKSCWTFIVISHARVDLMTFFPQSHFTRPIINMSSEKYLFFFFLFCARFLVCRVNDINRMQYTFIGISNIHMIKSSRSVVNTIIRTPIHK